MKMFFSGILLLIVLAALVVWFGVFRVNANPPEPAVAEGKPAPDFTLQDQDGKPVTLSEQRGKWVVLYFYPKDDTPGCTKEACSFRDNLLAIQRLDAKILGVSVDTVESHKKFAEKFKLNFPILADDRQQVTAQYGVLTSFMGIKVARRSTVIIDPQGIVRKIFPSVKPEDHALEIHRALVELRNSATPAPKS
ncbi:MAG TPA: peroxiredoxin [Nitrospiria bacterium]|nr:peroxiredoxin [Nitrospiria bacterium]